MINAIDYLLDLALFFGGMFLFYLGMWWLWCAILPQLWVSGPENLIHPNFWVFAGAWILGSSIGRAIFGRRKE